MGPEPFTSVLLTLPEKEFPRNLSVGKSECINQRLDMCVCMKCSVECAISYYLPFHNVPSEMSSFWVFNPLWPSVAIWRHISGWTLAQALAYCLTVPSDYLSQCWLIISKVQWHLRAISREIPEPSITSNGLKIIKKINKICQGPMS